MNHVMNTYASYPLTLTRGAGSRVFDSDGKVYIDFVGGIAVNTLGHAHPALVKAIADQAGTMLHCSNLYHIPLQIQLANKLCALSGMGAAFFCNSGAEANEAAIKLARKFFYDKKENRFEIITAIQSFHGRTMHTLAATGQEKVKIGFSPLPAGFSHVPYNDLDALNAAITDRTAAIMLEPLQGEGGVNLANAEYLRQVRTICDQHGLLLILDEVQSGIGRTGSMFASEHSGVRPDILTLAKGLGGGVPIGSMLATERVSPAFSPGTHGSTFGGNPLSCRAALTVLETIETESLLLHVQSQSQHMQLRLQSFIEQFDMVQQVRVQGFLLGLAFNVDVAPVITRCRELGLLVLSAGPQVVRMLPALNISQQLIDEGLDILQQAIEDSFS